MIFTFLLTQFIFSLKETTPNVILEDYELISNRISSEDFTESLTTIAKNKFSNIKSADFDGGAIYINKKSCFIDDCIFESCGGKKGGAIYAGYSTQNYYNLTISNSVFNGCEAAENGGALHLSNSQYKAKHYINILRCTFTSNTAASLGGAIYGSIRDQFFVQGCTFENSQATSGSSLWIIYGADNTVPDESDLMTIYDCTFKYAPSETNKINIHIENVEIKNTTEDGPSTNIYFGGCTFSSESTIEEMKHLEIEEKKGGIQSIHFDKCNCVGQTEETISIPEAFKPLYNFTFSCSSLDSCQPDDEQKPNITPDPQYPNQITERYEDKNETINTENTEYYEIRGDVNGGAILVDKARVSVTLKHCKFTYCNGKMGGAVYLNYAGTADTYTASITDTIFYYCSSSKDGGAIYLIITQPKLHSFTVDGCKFISNTAGEEGGAIYAKARDLLTIKNSNFEGNVAKNEGSSVYIQAGWDASGDKGDTIILTGNTFLFTPTEASVNVYIETVSGQNKNVALELGDCKFTTATSRVTDFKNLQLVEKSLFESIKFSGCNCVQQGFDSISVPDSAYPIDHFSFNCDPNGACTPDDPIQPPPVEKPDSEGFTAHDRISEDSSKDIFVNMTKFPNLDHSDVDGGGIYAVKVNCEVLNCKFNRCKALSGGAIYIKYTGSSNNYVGLVTKTSFNSCEASENGGAIYFELTQRGRHSLTIDDCEFEYNEAAKKGGAIYAKARDLLTIMHCKFDSNSATSGSSIWCEAGYNSDKDLENNIMIVSNTFIFSPKEGSSNVYIKSYKYDSANEKYGANAVLTLSLCSFSAQMASSSNYKHIHVDDTEGAFKSVNIPDCICVQQNSETVQLPNGVSTGSIKYDCQNLNSCGPDSEGYDIHDQIIDQNERINVKDAKFLYHSNEELNGGSISINKNKVSCTLVHCKFDTCRSGFGGAIYIAYSGNTDTYVCSITDTLFTKCVASKNGGALYVSNTQANRHSINITGCTFTNNEAQNGGAIYADSRDQFTLTNCVFEDNTASINGSSLWCRLGWNDRYTKNEARIENNKFTFTPTKNSQKYGDANVYIRSYTLNNDVTPNANLIFGGNTFSAKESSITKYKHLNVEQYKSQFESIEFTGCSCVAQEKETVVLPTIYNPDYFFSFNCQNQESCTPASVQTPKPTPDEDGYIPSGKISRYEFDPKLVLSKVKFVNLVAEENINGGAMYINCVSIKLSDCLFDSCSSNLGGGIYLSYSRTNSNFTCYIFNTLFNNCKATNGAAFNFAINQPKRHYVTIEQSTFTNNIATKNGGALYGLARDNLVVQKCVFTDNKAVNGASVWCRIGQDQPSALDPNDRAIFYDNTFSFSPDVNNSVNVYVESNKLNEDKDPNANVFIGKNTFTSVNPDYLEYNHLKIVEVGKFQSIQFSACNCIQGAESTVSITASEKPNTENLIFNCENSNQCPAESAPQLPTTGQCPRYSARQESFGSSLSIESTCFSNLVSPLGFDGGAIRVSNAKFEAEECHFTNCSSESNGGAIYVTFSKSDCELEIEECVFDSCYAGKQGGAVYFVNQVSSCKSSIEKCKFTNNVAGSGAGAFYYSPCANSEMKKNIFINNTCIASKSQGTSLYVYIENREINVFSKKKIKEDNDDDDKKVVIEGNRFRSDPVQNSQLLYINLKKTGHLEFNSNAFSFNNTEEIPNNSNYIYLSKDDGAKFVVKDEICVDNQESHVSGIDSEFIKTDCHTADSVNDKDMDFGNDGKGGKKGANVGMIVGIVVAVVVVIAIVIVVVFIVLKKKASGRYISDLNHDEIADNSTTQATEDPHEL